MLENYIQQIINSLLTKIGKVELISLWAPYGSYATLDKFLEAIFVLSISGIIKSFSIDDPCKIKLILKFQHRPKGNNNRFCVNLHTDSHYIAMCQCLMRHCKEATTAFIYTSNETCPCVCVLCGATAIHSNVRLCEMLVGRTRSGKGDVLRRHIM